MSARGDRGAWQNPQAVQAVLSPEVGTSLAGAMDWDSKRGSKYLVRVKVDVGPGPWDWLAVEMGGSIQRPASPTLSFFSAHGFVRRLCVNGAHDFRQWTHEHQVRQSGVVATVPPYLTPVPSEPSIESGTWERVFLEFVAACRIVVPSEFDWQSPWEGA